MIVVPPPDYVQYSNRISRHCHSMIFKQVHTARGLYKSCSGIAFLSLLHACIALMLSRLQSASSNTEDLEKLDSEKLVFNQFLAVLVYFTEL